MYCRGNLKCIDHHKDKDFMYKKSIIIHLNKFYTKVDMINIKIHLQMIHLGTY